MRGGNSVRAVLAALGGMVLAVATIAAASAEEPRERGAYLVKTIGACGNCHTPKDKSGKAIAGQELSGGLEFDIPPAHVVSPNITPDRESGIGSWSEAQIVAALRDGKRPDGTIIGPPMPIDFYRRISDRDAAAITAYLRGVRPIRHAVGRTQYKIPLPPAYGPPVGHVDEPPRADMAFDWYAKIAPADLDALVAYLRSLKPVK